MSGNRYRTHCGLHPGDHRRNSVQVTPRNATCPRASPRGIFTRARSPRPAKGMSVSQEGMRGGLPMG